MRKKIILMTIMGLVISISSLCQSAIPIVNPNAEHDRMHRLVLESEKNEAPDFAITAFKLFAKEKGYSEQNIQRNIILFKPLYNKNVSKDDKIFVTKILMRMCENPLTTIPVHLVNKAVKDISQN